MSFSRRDRAKVNAALLSLQSGGHDISEVTRTANFWIQSGTPERIAYDRAFNGLVAHNPALHAPLQRIGQLIDRADGPTLARYAVAMTAYAETGDAAHIETVLPLVQHNLAVAARETGDAGFAENLPARAALDDAGSGTGWGPTGYSAKAANAPPPAPLAPTEPGRAGWGPMGYSAAEASAMITND